jgi:hypothetical protein
MSEKKDWFCACTQSYTDPIECVQNNCVTREKVNELAQAEGIEPPFALEKEGKNYDSSHKVWLREHGFSTKQIGRRHR